jgi:rhodanese-related sulfurtransferase
MALTPQQLVDQARSTIQEIEAESLITQLQQTPMLIDVREPSEFAQGHLQGAINMPRGLLEFQILNHPNLTQGHETEIVLYCLSGGRSALSAQSLEKMGCSKVQSLSGGIKRWLELGYPVL